MRKILENDGKHISGILLSTSCRKHGVSEGMACFYITPGASTNGTILSGVCGARVKRAGYNGQINPLSLRLKTPGGRSGGHKR